MSNKHRRISTTLNSIKYFYTLVFAVTAYIYISAFVCLVDTFVCLVDWFYDER